MRCAAQSSQQIICYTNVHYVKINDQLLSVHIKYNLPLCAS